MAPVTHLLYEASCPTCGGVHSVRAQTAIAEWDAPGFHELRRGDAFRLAPDLTRRGYVAVAARDSGAPLRVLEDGHRCGGEALWTEVTVAGDVISDLRLIRCDRETLDRVHFLCSGHCVFWDWVASLPDPSDWNDDLYSADQLQNLRLRLMLREPVQARNAHEVDLFIETLGCTPTGPLVAVERDGTRLWQRPCRGGSELRPVALDLVFALDDERQPPPGAVIELPGGPSKILPADVFRHRADRLVAAVPLYTADLDVDGGRELLAKARHDLGQAIIYLEQLLAYIPAGEQVVPASSFWGDAMRAAREARADRYTRARIEATLARWRDELAHLGTRPVPTVRSAEEAQAYLMLHPCPRCARPTPELGSELVGRGADLVSVYAGPCPGCGLGRRFELRLDEALPPAHDDDAVVYGAGRSASLDPGQFLAVSELLSRRVPADPATLDSAARQRAAYTMQLAIGALDEALKFAPATAETVALETITSRSGWSLYDEEPGRFARARLLAVRGAYRQVLARL